MVIAELHGWFSDDWRKRSYPKYLVVVDKNQISIFFFTLAEKNEVEIHGGKITSKVIWSIF